MGKLIERLKQVGQGSGSSLGFLPRREVSGKARPAAVFATLRASDAGVAEALAKAGIDAIIISGWKPGANLSAVKSALNGASTLWGVQYDGAGEDDPVKAASDAGAGFILFGADAAVAAVFDEPDKFDRVVSLTTPQNEMDILTFRLVNTLPVQAAIITLPVGVKNLAGLPLDAFARLAVVGETLRFPLLATVDEAPDARACRALVRLGIDGIVLPGVGVDAETLAAQVRTIQAELEKIPMREEVGGVSLGGLMSGLGASLTRPERKPEEPDEE